MGCGMLPLWGHMKYIDRVLGQNEEIIHETGLHWIVFLAPIACLIVAIVAARDLNPNDVGKTPVAAFVAFVFGIMGLCGVIRGLIDWLTTEIAVTTHRVVYKRGLIARDTIEINFNRIEGLDVRQSILGRILNFGTVVIRGTGLGVQPMRDVAGPINLRKAAFGDG
jgi:uncharacterized membrane protein YdbT with pleckstrin-like domain